MQNTSIHEKNKKTGIFQKSTLLQNLNFSQSWLRKEKTTAASNCGACLPGGGGGGRLEAL